VILGCTELPLMIKENDLSVPIVNTSEIHVQKIVDEMLS
jgi:aspartate racemase